MPPSVLTSRRKFLQGLLASSALVAVPGPVADVMTDNTHYYQFMSSSLYNPSTILVEGNPTPGGSWVYRMFQENRQRIISGPVWPAEAESQGHG